MLIALTLLACLADIRPDGLTDDGEKGQALLEAAAQAAGAQAYASVQGSTSTMRDVWPAPYGFFAPWPETEQSFVIKSVHPSFDTEVLFLDGKAQGTSWGISDWKTWEKTEEGEASWSKNKDAQFILPTMHYFMEFPFRMLEAPVVRYAGMEDIDGVSYERVFVTWESVEPSSEYDQYVIYIDPETERIAKAYYTVREAGRIIAGTMHFLDMREVDGVWFSYEMVVTGKPQDSLEEPLHRVVVEEIVLGEVVLQAPDNVSEAL